MSDNNFERTCIEADAERRGFNRGLVAGLEQGRAKEAAKYKPLVALASRVPDPCKGRTCKCESNCRWKKEWLAMRDIIAALKALEEYDLQTK